MSDWQISDTIDHDCGWRTDRASVLGIQHLGNIRSFSGVAQMIERLDKRAKSDLAAGPDFDITKAWAESRHTPDEVYQAWRAFYRAYGAARKQFPNVDWISLIAILDVIAMATAHRRRVDISYLAEELGWPRSTTLRRLQKYHECGHLMLSREGRHTYVNKTRESRRAALIMIDAMIDSIERGLGPHPLD